MSQTGHALHLKAKRFHTLDQVSADGVHFPSDTAAFLEEVHNQGCEPYGRRAGLRMHVDLLLRGARAAPPTDADAPDFCTQMQLLLPYPAVPAVDAALTPGEVLTALGQGSEACGLDELPRSVLQGVGGHALSSLVRLLGGPGAGGSYYVRCSISPSPRSNRPGCSATSDRCCWRPV